MPRASSLCYIWHNIEHTALMSLFNYGILKRLCSRNIFYNETFWKSTSKLCVIGYHMDTIFTSTEPQSYVFILVWQDVLHDNIQQCHDGVIKWKHIPCYWPSTGHSSQRPVSWSFDVFFDVCLDKWLSKLLRVWVIELTAFLGTSDIGVHMSPLSWLVIGDGNFTSVYNDPKYLTSSLTEIEPRTAITNQPEETKEKR